MKFFFTILIVFVRALSFGQSQTIHALFIGNSYTSANNLPQIISDLATSMGDTLVFDSHTPGGMNLYSHARDSVSINKIMTGGWDYVVLQEQSQRPSWPDNWVQTDVFPPAHSLDSMIHLYNVCAETMFYMTWGYKNGDGFNCAAYSWWPYACTYESMDSLTNLRYRMMADSNHAVLSPAGAVWHYIRTYFPSIELYQSDDNHPSQAGSYAAACCFYTALFRKDPTLIPFNSNLSATDASIIKNVTKQIVYDSLFKWHIGSYDPVSNFTYTFSGPGQVEFIDHSVNATDITWIFGDGDSASGSNPVHVYSLGGTYNVTQIAARCGRQSISDQIINISTGIQSGESKNSSWNIDPNFVSSTLIIRSETLNHLNYKIYSSHGIEIQSGEMNNSITQIDIGDLPAGLYLMQVFENKLSLGQQKFIKVSR